jgi:hypothetical protein
MSLPNPGHLEDLRASGLSDETILRAAIYSAPEHGVRDVLGYGGGPGLVFPYQPLDEADEYARVKLDHADAEGKRYRSPAGRPPRLYMPRLLDPNILLDPTVPLWITEGEKKALRAAQDGLNCIAVGGVWNWKGRVSPDSEKTAPIPDLDRVNWTGRTACLCFDYDPKPDTRRNTERAVEAFAQELRRRGAAMSIVHLPPGPNGAKQGLDDYLMIHTPRELWALVPITIPLSTMPASGADVYSFLGLEYPPAETYIEGILPAHSSGFIAGPEKSGKSYYALEEALCLALGIPVAGYFGVPTPRRVYYIAEEDHPERVQRRLRALLKGHGLDADDPEVKRSLSPWFAIRPQGGVSLDKPEWIETIRAVCRDFKPHVIYLDVLRKLTALDIEKWVESGKLLEVLDSIRREFPGVLFRILHHGTKPRGRRREMAPGDLLGSANLGAWWETSLFFSRVSSDPTEGSRVRCRSKDIPDTPPFILKTHLEGPWGNPERIWLTAEPEDDTSTTARIKSRKPGKVPLTERVYTALATATTTTATEGEDGVLNETVAHDLDVSERAARDAMTELVKAGRVDQCGRVRGKSGPATPLYRQA